jgi:hypothetical protein
MKFSIVGAGITGCITALNLKNLGHEVDVYDKSSDIGGTLRDIDSESGHWFKGCQYLSNDASWLNKYKVYLNKLLYSFDHKYCSYTNFYSKKKLEYDFALPSIDKAFLKEFESTTNLKSLNDRFNLYEKDIASFLDSLVLRTGHKSINLDYRCSASLQLSAILFNNDYEEMLKKKSNNKTIDSLCALPRKVFYSEEPNLKASLPIEGYNSFFKSLYSIMKKKGINVYLNTGVTVRRCSNKIIPFIKHEQINTDFLIWCCNPVKLVMVAGLGKLDSPVSKFKHIHCFVEGLEINSPIYFQCFDNTTSLYRLYFYPTKYDVKLCIECFANTEETEIEIFAKVKNITFPLFDNYKIRLWKTDIFYSYYLYSNNDYKKFKKLNNIALDNNIIPGAWEIFGRDQKIDFIANLIRQST